MSLFAIADLHLSLGEDKPMDIFAGWDNYVERLTKNWNTLVTDDDTVMIAGDISWAMKLEQTYTDFKYIDDLPGKKIFLKGNHDYWWNTKNKITRKIGIPQTLWVSTLSALSDTLSFSFSFFSFFVTTEE